jgi:hypothetical protein
MPITASLVIGGISAVGKIAGGFAQTAHAKKLAKNNIRPTFDIQKEYFENRDIAANMAQRGLSDQALSFYGDQAGRGLSASAAATLQGGGGINALQGQLDTYQQGIRSIAAQDAELQNNNIKFFTDRNADLAKQKVQKWVIDKYEPFKDTAKAAAQERAAGLQNINTGVSEGLGVVSNAAMAGLNKDLLQGASGASNATQSASNPVTTYTEYAAGYNPNTASPFQDPYDVVVTPPAAQDMEISRRYNSNRQYTPAELQELYDNIEAQTKRKI